MNIRKATQSDIEQIISIYESVALDRRNLNNYNYQEKVQKHGFLLGLESKSDFEKYIAESHAFLVYVEKEKVVGYIIADHREKFIDDEYKKWYDLDAKHLYYTNNRVMTISSIAIDPKQASKGIGTLLENELENQLKKQNFTTLFSIITIAPLTNCPSIIFHTKLKFHKIAFGKPRTLFNLENYVSTLLMKELK